MEDRDKYVEKLFLYTLVGVYRHARRDLIGQNHLNGKGEMST